MPSSGANFALAPRQYPLPDRPVPSHRVRRPQSPPVASLPTLRYYGKPRIAYSAVLPAPRSAASLPGVSHVIHTVGPIFSPSRAAESRALLRSAYRTSAELAKRHGLRRIAFPAISCGIFGYPLREGALDALESLAEASEGIDEVHFVLFEEDIW